MGESRQLITRREILKRGAIAGGAVLWVTPVVQTLGLGAAHAATVSGGDPCAMTLRIECSPTSNQVLIVVCVPPGCPGSAPLPYTDTVALYDGGNVYLPRLRGRQDGCHINSANLYISRTTQYSFQAKWFRNSVLMGESNIVDYPAQCAPWSG